MERRSRGAQKGRQRLATQGLGSHSRTSVQRCVTAGSKQGNTVTEFLSQNPVSYPMTPELLKGGSGCRWAQQGAPVSRVLDEGDSRGDGEKQGDSREMLLAELGDGGGGAGKEGIKGAARYGGL